MTHIQNLIDNPKNIHLLQKKSKRLKMDWSSDSFDSASAASSYSTDSWEMKKEEIFNVKATSQSNAIFEKSENRTNKTISNTKNPEPAESELNSKSSQTDQKIFKEIEKEEHEMNGGKSESVFFRLFFSLLLFWGPLIFKMCLYSTENLTFADNLTNESSNLNNLPDFLKFFILWIEDLYVRMPTYLGISFYFFFSGLRLFCKKKALNTKVDVVVTVIDPESQENTLIATDQAPKTTHQLRNDLIFLFLLLIFNVVYELKILEPSLRTYKNFYENLDNSTQIRNFTEYLNVTLGPEKYGPASLILIEEDVFADSDFLG